MELGEGFLTRVLKRCEINRDGGSCWTWTGSLRDGYGSLRAGRGGAPASLHRLVWEHVHEPIPKPWVIDHLCRNRACCNPDHMELVTNRENALRGVGVGALHALKTHCPKGHAYTPENTIVGLAPVYKRRCRICRRAYERALNARKRAAGIRKKR